jgi:hypothetical protein
MRRFLFLALILIAVSILLLIPFTNPFVIKENNIIPENAERVNLSQIDIEQDRIVISISNPSISRYANTSSMIPVITENTKGINIVPKSSAEIKVGDIITYEKDNILIVHRVIEIGTDEKGWYAIAKGDSTEQTDGKIRFSQIKSILIGILY